MSKKKNDAEKKFYIKIGKSLVCFEYQSDIVTKVLEKEYELIKEIEDYNKNVLLHVRIFLNQRPSDTKAKMVQLFKARNRSFYIEYISLEEISLYIPYKESNSILEKISNPYFENKWEMCICDFLHNIFLGMLQMKMLERGMTLLHASVVQVDESTNVVFVGGAQVGKSTIAKAWGGCSAVKIVAEDFSICENGKEIYALPHMGRVSVKEYRQMKKRTVADYVCQYIFGFVYGVLKRKYVRHASFKEVFGEANFAIGGPISRVFFCKRKGEEIKKATYESADFINESIEVMRNEFVNFVGFKECLEIISGNSGNALDIEKILEKTKEIISNLYKSVDCMRLEIPRYENVKILGEKLDEFLMTDLQSRYM